MKKDRTGLIFLGIAFIGFLFVKILPMYKPMPTHETGKVSTSKGGNEENDIPKVYGKTWFLHENGDTLAEVAVEILKSAIQVKKGLKGRAVLEPGNGMLYIFPNSDIRAFWMKGTSISLDIIYINSFGKIDSYFENTSPFSENPLSSKGRVKYVLEVNSGFMQENNITKDCLLIFDKI